MHMITGGIALNRLGVERLLNLIKLRMPDNIECSSQTMGDKFHSREGNKPIKLRMPDNVSTAVRLWEISFMVKRETAQTHS